ncbi:hypothetical protein [Burkholderia gladioli]|uniref:hypothetical protein n=1 Tax=Burkholderia gladioli TaxID=28095 RepID=UPI001641B17C|nr:hypothetical protein [Burkholderia gladioli]
MNTASLFAKDDWRKKTEALGPTDICNIVMSLRARAADDDIVTIAPGIAKRILEEANFKGQRKVRPIRCRKHLNRLRDKTWNPNFPVTFAFLPNGEIVLVDGQHRLQAIVEFDAGVRVRVNLVEAGSYDEVQRLYAGFDEADSSRSEIEVVDGIGLTETSGVSRAVVRSSMRALAVILNGMEPAQGTDAEWEARLLDSRIRAFDEWRDEIVAWHEIAKRADSFIRKKLLNGGTMAVGIYTLKHQPARAIEFWMGVSENNGLGKHDARARLVADFANRSYNSGSSRQVLQAPAVAWNAWNEHRELKVIKCIDGAAITIWGTPYANGNR